MSYSELSSSCARFFLGEAQSKGGRCAREAEFGLRRVELLYSASRVRLFFGEKPPVNGVSQQGKCARVRELVEGVVTLLDGHGYSDPPI